MSPMIQQFVVLFVRNFGQIYSLLLYTSKIAILLSINTTENQSSTSSYEHGYLLRKYATLNKNETLWKTQPFAPTQLCASSPLCAITPLYTN
jgi:hypothetical protein